MLVVPATVHGHHKLLIGLSLVELPPFLGVPLGYGLLRELPSVQLLDILLALAVFLLLVVGLARRPLLLEL